jgi:hypothetical protein
MSYQPTPIEQTLLKFIKEMRNNHGIVDMKLEVMPEHEWVVHGNFAIGNPRLGRAKIVGYTVNISFSIPEKLNPLPTKQ